MPKISIIMPVHNCADYINQAIESILNQTFSDFELQILDDGSTDNTFNIARGYRDSRVSVRSLCRVGIVKALNLGLRASQGEYIARHDGDDFSHPKRFELQIGHLEGDNHSVVGSAMLLVDKEGFPFEIMRYPTHPVIGDLMKSCCVAHPTVMFKREVYEKIGGYDEDFNQNCCEDYDFWLRAIEHFRIYNSPRVLYTKREHSKSNVSVNRHLVPIYDELARVKSKIRRANDHLNSL